ncbi:hypothetical protein AOLI_G00240190 [Acnodon oligacanthus]
MGIGSLSSVFLNTGSIRSIATPLRMRVQLLVALAMTRAEGGLALPRRKVLDSIALPCGLVSRLHAQAKSRAEPSRAERSCCGSVWILLRARLRFQKPEANVRSRLRFSPYPA